MTKERHEEIVRSCRKEDNDIMHLSSDEVSEIVYLSYLADMRYSAADYDAACRRCLRILKPVKDFKTAILLLSKRGRISPDRRESRSERYAGCILAARMRNL